MVVVIDGNSLNLEDFIRVAIYNEKVELSNEARKTVIENRKKVELMISKGEPIYGINTGFGELVNLRIDEIKERELQINLLRSHSTGYGEPLKREFVRGIILSRANALAKGYSGVTPELIDLLIEFLNKDIIPYIPEKGSVGASGDLSPLAHLALVLIGEWKIIDQGRIRNTSQVFEERGIKPLELKEKEGLSLINGTSYMLSLMAIAYWYAELAIKNSYISTAWSFSTLKATDKALSLELAKARNFPELIRVSEVIANIINDNDGVILGRKTKVQDAYSLRCAPTVLASVLNTMKFVKETLERELNAATDNPLIFNEPISGCNFHGEPIALAADYLAIALTDLGNIIERRIFRILDSKLSGLNPFLANNPGLESGLMISQYVAAALCNENKVLATPSSIDNIPTSANQEDHVSMGATSARKLNQIVDNLIGIISIELLVNYKASLMYGISGKYLTMVFKELRGKLGDFKGDVALTPYIEKISMMIKNGELISHFGNLFNI